MDFSPAGALVLPVLALVVVVGLLVLALAIILNRGDPDESGRRSTAIYLAVVTFISLFAVILAAVAAVGSISGLIVDEEDRGGGVGLPLEENLGLDGEVPDASPPGVLGDDSSLDSLAEACFDGDLDACDAVYLQSPVGSEYEAYGETCGGRNSPDPSGCAMRYDTGGSAFGTDVFAGSSGTDPDDEAIRGAVQAGLIALAAAVVFVFHDRRRRELLAEPDFAGTPAWRADRAFLYAVSAIAVLIALFSAAAVFYDLFRLIAPGITSDASQGDEREQALADLIPILVLACTTGYVFGRYWAAAAGEPPFWASLRRSPAPETGSERPPPPQPSPSG